MNVVKSLFAALALAGASFGASAEPIRSISATRWATPARTRWPACISPS